MKDYKITFTGRKKICENTFSFHFSTGDSGYSFKPGQYAYFTLTGAKYKDVKGNSRPFSFAGSPHIKDNIMIAARVNSSVFVRNLCELKEGSEVFVSKPGGNLFFPDDMKLPVVFITGGTGITPVRSIIEFLIHNKSGRNIYLFYSNKSPNRTAFYDDFKIWSESYKNFTFIPAVDSKEAQNPGFEQGYINIAMLRKYLKELSGKRYILTGPDEMTDSMKKILLSENVSISEIGTDKLN